MNERTRRIGENEAIFRTFNEEVEALSASVTVAQEMRVVCECGARSCTDQFAIDAAEYARVRQDPTMFIVKPGHDLPETETVVAKAPVYWVVRKDPGLPAAIARETAPGARDG